MQLLNLFTECSEKVSSFPGTFHRSHVPRAYCGLEHSTYDAIKCIAVEAHGHTLRVYKNARNKPSELTLDKSHGATDRLVVVHAKCVEQACRAWLRSSF